MDSQEEPRPRNRDMGKHMHVLRKQTTEAAWKYSRVYKHKVSTLLPFWKNTCTKLRNLRKENKSCHIGGATFFRGYTLVREPLASAGRILTSKFLL